MPKLLFTTSSFNLNNFHDRAEVEAAGYELQVNPWGKRLTEDQVASLLDDDVVGIVAGLEPLTGMVMRKAPRLKVIARCGIGMDNVDLAAAQESGITVVNTPGGPTRSAAELTLAHILSLIRRIPESDRNMRRGDCKPLMGSLLSEQTVGVIGYGRIGRTVVKLLEGFGPSILVYDIAMPIGVRNGIEFASLDKVLSRSDIVTLHVPYADDTRHLIGVRRLALMKPGSYLVNVARGGLIDEGALLDALQSGRLGGAALDCCEIEPYSGPLLDLEQVQFTSHMGSYAKEARTIMEEEACRVLVDGLRKHGLV